MAICILLDNINLVNAANNDSWLKTQAPPNHWTCNVMKILHKD